MRISCRSMVFLAALAVPLLSLAQQYPSKPIRVIVGKAVGTNPDVNARLLAGKLDKRVGQPVVVENRVGANGTIAAKAVIAAEPDGYTLLVDSVAALHPVFTANNAVDAGRDMTAVSNMFFVPYVLYSSGKLSAGNWKDLLSFAKSNPKGKLNHASTAPQLDLVMAVLENRAGLTASNIPYKGGGPAAITALISGEADLTISGVVPFPPHVQAGTIKALFVMSPRRTPLLPGVPTAAELELRNLEVGTNIGIWGQKGMPAAVVQRLGTEAAVIGKDPEIVETSRKTGTDPLGTTAEEQLRTFEAEIRFWSEAAKLANFKPQ